MLYYVYYGYGTAVEELLGIFGTREEAERCRKDNLRKASIFDSDDDLIDIWTEEELKRDRGEL